MDGLEFDAWTRRRFGFAAGGMGAWLLSLAALDKVGARRMGGKKRRRKRKRRKERLHVCAGKNSCQAEAYCHSASSEIFCFCYLTAETGEPFCSQGSVIADCADCTEGQTCVILVGGRCGDLPTACADPCPSPERR